MCQYANIRVGSKLHSIAQHIFSVILPLPFPRNTTGQTLPVGSVRRLSTDRSGHGSRCCVWGYCGSAWSRCNSDVGGIYNGPDIICCSNIKITKRCTCKSYAHTCCKPNSRRHSDIIVTGICCSYID